VYDSKNLIEKVVHDTQKRLSSVLFLFSSNSNQSSYCDDENSHFTKAFIEGVVHTGKTVNADDEIEYFGIIAHIKNAFKNNKRQNPNYNIQGDLNTAFCLNNATIMDFIHKYESGEYNSIITDEELSMDDNSWNKNMALAWHNMKEPSRPSKAEINIYGKYFEEVSSKISNPCVLILGSTIEFRKLALEKCFRATVVDISEKRQSYYII